MPCQNSLHLKLVDFIRYSENICVDLADRMTDMAKALTGYLDSTTDSGKHGKLIQLIDSIDTISELLSVGTVYIYIYKIGSEFPNL